MIINYLKNLFIITTLLITSCKSDESRKGSSYVSFPGYDVIKLTAEEGIPEEAEKKVFVQKKSDQDFFVRIFDSVGNYKDYTVDSEGMSDLFKIIQEYYEDDAPNNENFVTKITDMLGFTESGNSENRVNWVPGVATSESPKNLETDSAPSNMTISYHTFQMSDGFAPIQKATFRVSGLCNAKCGGSAHAMGTHALKDLFFVSWMSARDIKRPISWYGTKNYSGWWDQLYNSNPGLETSSEFRQFGNMTVFKEIQKGKFEKFVHFSFKNRCESIHDITSNKTGTLIALLCEGYPNPKYLIRKPFSAINDLLYGENNYCQKDDKPGVNCGMEGIRGHSLETGESKLSESYILEYHGGLFESDGTPKIEPDEVLLINTAAGGARYSHNELHFICEHKDGTKCDEESGKGGRYIAVVKSMIGKHEKTVGYTITRPMKEGDLYTMKHGGFGAGSPGHGRAARLAYNSALKAVGAVAGSDACPNIEEPEKTSIYTINGKFNCQGAAWGSKPLSEDGITGGSQMILLRQNPEGRQQPYTQTGGVFGLVSLGVDGWMVLGAGPGRDHQNPDLPKPLAIGVMPVKEIKDGEGFSAVFPKWKWYNNNSQKQYNKLSLPSGYTTKAMGYGNIAYFGENSEDTTRLLFGGVRSIRQDYPYDPDNLGIGDQISTDPLFFLAEMDRKGDILANSITMLETGYGWGEEDRWVTMDSGCVVFPWVANKDVKGGYPRGGYGITEDTDFNEELKDDQGNPLEGSQEIVYYHKFQETGNDDDDWRAGEETECARKLINYNTRKGEWVDENNQGGTEVGVCRIVRWPSPNNPSKLSKEMQLISVCPK